METSGEERRTQREDACQYLTELCFGVCQQQCAEKVPPKSFGGNAWLDVIIMVDEECWALSFSNLTVKLPNEKRHKTSFEEAFRKRQKILQKSIDNKKKYIISSGATEQLVAVITVRGSHHLGSFEKVTLRLSNVLCTGEARKIVRKKWSTDINCEFYMCTNH